MPAHKMYSFVSNCRGGKKGGGGGVKLQILGKNPQVHLIIINTPLPTILRNFDNFPRGTFYSIPPKIRHERVG